MNARPDLLHLSPEALAQAANAGVVKRAQRELQGGYRPQWVLETDGTLEATFSDGIRTRWPAATPLQQVVCSCGATSVCRHRIILALAYREAQSDDAGAEVASPGQASDEQLARLVPASLLAKAALARDGGLVIDIRRRASGEPCDTARLPNATVRFWAGAAIEAARCDCLAKAACEHVALGVWAFRQADQEEPAADASRIRLGQQGDGLALDTAPWLALAEALIRHGVTAGAAPMAQALSQAMDAARAAKAAWLEHLLQDLERWGASYAARSALYDAGEGVALLAELSLRLRAGVLPGNARAVLGIGQGGETELDRLRLICLGARTSRDGEMRRTRLMLADADTGTALALVKEWSVPATEFEREGALRASVRLAPGVLLESLAQGQLLATQARRLADGTIKLAGSRSSQNSVLPQVPDWSLLGPPLRYDSVQALAARQQAQPTAQVLPRHAARSFVVFTPQSLEQLAYDPDSQSIVAVLRDASDEAVIVRRVHQSHARHALDALAAALAGDNGPVRYVAGLLHWAGGLPVIEPWAVACNTIVVPDFAAGTGALGKTPLGVVPGEALDPISIALRALRDVLAALLHHGTAQLPLSWQQDCAQAVRGLAGQSLHTLARQLQTLGEAALAARANPANVSVASLLLDLAALAQLHEDAQVMAGLEQRSGSVIPVP